MTNISPFEKNTAKNDKLAIIWKVVIGVLAIGVAVVLFFIFQNLSSKPTPVPPGSPPATKTGK